MLLSASCAPTTLSLQLLVPERGTGGELQLLSFRGFDPRAKQIFGSGFCAQTRKVRAESALRSYPSGWSHQTISCLRIHGPIQKTSRFIFRPASTLRPDHAAHRPHGKGRRDDLHPLAHTSSPLWKGFS